MISLSRGSLLAENRDFSCCLFDVLISRRRQQLFLGRMTLLRVSDVCRFDNRGRPTGTKDFGHAPDICILTTLDRDAVFYLQIALLGNEIRFTTVCELKTIAVTEPVTFQCSRRQPTQCGATNAARYLTARRLLARQEQSRETANDSASRRI